MPRGKKTQANPVTEMPVIEVAPVMGEPDKVIVEPNEEQSYCKENSNVIPFTGTDQPVQNSTDTTQIDQFIAQYGIEIV